MQEAVVRSLPSACRIARQHLGATVRPTEKVRSLVRSGIPRVLLGVIVFACLFLAGCSGGNSSPPES